LSAKLHIIDRKFFRLDRLHMEDKMDDITIPGFKKVPQTGVIYVMHKAIEKGYKPFDKTWSNLGQGAPETGAIKGSTERITEITIEPPHCEYSHVAGQKELRQKVAELYNFLYRQNKRSQYTWENVSIAGGGRIALTRVAASLGNINLGHLIPDYTAYEELLSVFNSFVPIPILSDPTFKYQITTERLKNEIIGRGLKALLMSNPCNPTGQVIKGDNLKEIVKLARDYQCTLIFDEFYSHYIYDQTESNKPTFVSAAEYIEDIESDPIVIIDGITKNWRYPGLRISWTLAPKEVIQTITSAGSFLDGGASHPTQNTILSILDPKIIIQNAKALQDCFRIKRDYAIKRLKHMGIEIEAEPQGTFYIWAKLSQLPAPLNDGFNFFEAGLNKKVITVPGSFFDINPEKRRSYNRFNQYVRISFGVEMDELVRGLDAIESIIKAY
jgi:aspartate/methionine/tyrosine aminotransferase